MKQGWITNIYGNECRYVYDLYEYGNYFQTLDYNF